MARTYKKRSKKNHMKRDKRKITRGGVGSLTSLRAAKKIQSAFRENTTRRKASALRQRHSAKKIQRSAHKAFDFLADDCTICLGSMAFKSKVAPISCGHGLHKKCLEDLLKSEAFKIPQNRKCPMCRAPAPEFQVKDDYDLDSIIREVIESYVGNGAFSPSILGTPENINKLIRRCKIKIWTVRYEEDRLRVIIRDYLMQIISIISNRWDALSEKLNYINNAIRSKTGQIKTKIDNSILENIRDNYLPYVLAYRRILRDKYNMDIPDITSRQIEDIRTLFIENDIDMPTPQQLYRVNSEIY